MKRKVKVTITGTYSIEVDDIIEEQEIINKENELSIYELLNKIENDDMFIGCELEFV